MVNNEINLNTFSAESLPSSFVARMKKLLGSEFSAFLQAYDTPLRRALRVNTLKCDVDRFKRVFALNLIPSPFSPHGFLLDVGHRAGADPLHHAGAYYMQEPSATAAVTILDPRPGERVLDLCAAPGGKSTQIAASLRGQGLLWSNEYVRQRVQVLSQNLERCGVRNAVVSNTDAKTIGDGLSGFFDVVLVDAPCSGEGMFRKEPAALSGWSEDNIRLCAARQAEILDAAAGAVAGGGRLLYSTCTFAPEENEGQVAGFLNHHPDFELVDLSRTVCFGRPGFTWGDIAGFLDGVSKPEFPLEFTRRILPADGGEGHFIALFRRVGEKNDSCRSFEYANQDTNCNMFNFLYEECFKSPLFGIPQTMGEIVRVLPDGLPSLRGLGVLSAGTAGAEILKNRLEPCHSLFMAAGSASECVSVLDFSLDDPRLTAFLRGETVEAPDKRGWTPVAVEGIVAGFGKTSGGVLKNRYPKGLRLIGR